MKILTISGSTRSASANTRLLAALPFLAPNHAFEPYTKLAQLPIFKADFDQHPWDAAVLDWRASVAAADAVIISIPEYLHNMPALIKNGLEWLSSSGELAQKRVLAITFTPHEPRGKKAMQSLLWTLQAMNANVVVSLPLYQQEVEYKVNGQLVKSETRELLLEAINLLLT